MPAKTSVGRDFQDNILGRLMAGNQITTLYLRNRMSLRGRVVDFDPYVILLDPLDGGPPHMVYKSAVVSISGPRAPQRRPGGPGGPRRGPGGPRPPRPEDGEHRPHVPYPPHREQHGSAENGGYGDRPVFRQPRPNGPDFNPPRA